MNKVFCLLLLLLSVGCGKGPEPLQYGKDQCEYCKMTISDPQFGAEIVTDKGRIYKFDAVECLIRFAKETNPGSPEIMITPYNMPGVLKSKDSLVFIMSSRVNSPMGAGLTAVTGRFAADSVFGKSEQTYTWEEIYAKIK